MTWIITHYHHHNSSLYCNTSLTQSSFILLLHHSCHFPLVTTTSHPNSGSSLLPQRNTLMAWKMGTAIQSQSRRRRHWSCQKRRKRRRRRTREPLAMQTKMLMRQRLLQIPRKRKRRRSGSFEQCLFSWEDPEMWPVCCLLCWSAPCVWIDAVLYWVHPFAGWCGDGSSALLRCNSNAYDVLIVVVLLWYVPYLVDEECWCVWWWVEFPECVPWRGAAASEVLVWWCVAAWRVPWNVVSCDTIVFCFLLYCRNICGNVYFEGCSNVLCALILPHCTCIILQFAAGVWCLVLPAQQIWSSQYCYNPTEYW